MAVTDMPAPDPHTATDWRELAECRGMEGRLFFDVPGPTPPPVREACERCPVREACLEEALSYPEHLDHGYWGGMSRMARMALRAERERDYYRKAMTAPTRG
jgi:WhiB family redox-sensing transcriptional regulator